jgi:L-asparaginase II
MGAVPLARVVRSGLEESIHLGHVAVCDTGGRLLWRAGDPSHPVFSRSCMKPLQAAVSLSAMGDAPLSEREIAVMCASHNGEPIHLGAVRSLLERASLGPDALQTPPGYPLDPGAMARVQLPNRLYHNCSGKHAGMVLACVLAGWDRSTYRRRSHALQRRIKRTVIDVTGIDNQMIGVDGCGVPVYGMPLRAMATMFARFARPELLGQVAGHAERAVGAMRAEPFLVGGSKRLDTDVMRSAPGIVVKEGAEALVCATVMDQGLGIAIKVQDGGYRACDPALIAALHQLDALTAANVRDLGDHAHPAVLGGDERVGVLEPLLTLRRR